MMTRCSATRPWWGFTVVLTINAACADGVGGLESTSTDGGLTDVALFRVCPSPSGIDAGIQTASIYINQVPAGTGLSAQLPTRPIEGRGPDLACTASCRITGQYPIDGGIPDYGPNASTGRITVLGMRGGVIAADPPDYVESTDRPLFADDETLDIASPGEVGDVPAIQVGLRKPVGVTLTAPSADPADSRVTMDRSRDLQLRWTRSSTATVGTVEVNLRGATSATGWQGDWQGDFHNVVCSFPVAADSAVIPAALLTTYEPGWMSFEFRVVQRVEVFLGGRWKAQVQAQSFRKSLSVQLQ